MQKTYVYVPAEDMREGQFGQVSSFFVLSLDVLCVNQPQQHLGA